MDDPEVSGLLAEGRKLQAITVYRDRYGVSWQEATEVIEALEVGTAPEYTGLASAEVRSPAPATAPSAPGPPPRVSAIDPEVLRLARTGQKIAAIKLLREQTGLGLKEAKDVVDGLEIRASPPPEASAPSDELWAEIDAMLREGRALEAVKLHRERTGIGLKESKDAVFLRLGQLGLGAPKVGCFIATAAYGSPLAPEVETLRRFRDDTLARSAPGRAFIHAYYRLSPPLAARLARSQPARSLVRRLLAPLVAACRRWTQP